MTDRSEAPDNPPLRDRAVLALLRRLPQGALSRGFGLLADLPLPRRLRRPVLGAFARAVGAVVAEAEHPLEEYPSLNAFFVRRLRPGVRSWPEDSAAVGSPVEGVVGQVGQVEEGRLIQAKGRWYTAADLLGDADEAERFDGGVFLTLYLSPKDYHRIHAPVAGRVPKARHIPGGLLPVNVPAVAHLPDLFVRNERLVCYLEGVRGRVAMVAVGAYNVGRISASFDPRWTAPAWATNRSGVLPETRRYDPAPSFDRGDEIMAFHLGSTVVLLFEPGQMRLRDGIEPGAAVRLGEGIGETRG